MTTISYTKPYGDFSCKQAVANIQEYIPDLLHDTFLEATNAVYAISEDLFLFNK